MAPCIKLSPYFNLKVDSKFGKRFRKVEWLGLGSTISVCCCIRYDTDDEEFTEFVLIQYGCQYGALCTKTVDEVSRRVEAAVWTFHKGTWDTLVKSPDIWYSKGSGVS